MVGNIKLNNTNNRNFNPSEYTELTDVWVTKTWNGFNNLNRVGIWKDGNTVYYSYAGQYVLDKSTSTWNSKSWNYHGYNELRAEDIWTDGIDMYRSRREMPGYYYEYHNFKLDRSTNTWNDVSWNGFNELMSGSYVWTDGTNTYYSSGSTHYVLDKSTNTWNTKTWNGLTSFGGSVIWTDGDNVYLSSGSSNQYVLDKSTSTWNTKTWNGFNNFSGNGIWTDGDNIYYSGYVSGAGYVNYVLDKSTNTWSTKTWYFIGGGVTNLTTTAWTDGTNIYYSGGGSNQYVLYKKIYIQ